MPLQDRSSAEALDERVPGELLASSKGRPWKDLLVQVFLRRPVQESLIIPAVPEPLIVWVLSGSAVVEERELGGEWMASRVRAGDFFLTASPKPCELRWTTEGKEPFQVMHVYLGLDLMKRAVRDVHGADPAGLVLREMSGANDPTLSMFLGQIRSELMGHRQPSTLIVRAWRRAWPCTWFAPIPTPAGARPPHAAGCPHSSSIASSPCSKSAWTRSFACNPWHAPQA